jgi:hypothetical protein
VDGISYSAEFFAFKIDLIAANLYNVNKKLYYNCSIMTIQDWLGLTLTSLTILTIIGVAVRWIIRHYLKDVVHELKPNGGSSLKDQVNRLEVKVEEADLKRKEMSKKIDHMYEVLLDYISRSSK